MKTIATLTVNPTIDKSTQVEQVIPEKKLRCEPPRREPGGGGINVSRAIRRLGGTSTTLYLAGGPTGEMLEKLLEKEELTQQVITIKNWTRENLIVYETSSTQQYRFGMPGPDVEEDEWQQCLRGITTLEPSPDYVVASGSLAPGMPSDFFRRVAEATRVAGARLILDTSGEALRQAADAGAYLLKPNVGELEDLAGRSLASEEEQEQVARDYIERGSCNAILLSLGAGGALLITAKQTEHIRSPTVPIRSKVGAGDSMVGGMVLALARGWPLEEAARFGVAAGASAVMTEGTELCRREDTERLYENISRSTEAAAQA